MSSAEGGPPHFRKTLTRTMLRSNERVGIPSWFVSEHGDKLHTVISMTGPNGKSCSVMRIVRLSGTCPRVYLGHNWLGFARGNGFRIGDNLSFWLVAKSSFHVTCEQGSLTSDGVKAPLVPSSFQLNCSPADLVGVVQFQKGRSPHQLPEMEYVKYPGISSAVRLMRRPHFVKKLGLRNVNGSHLRIELPRSFVKEHGDKFQACVGLLGASGHFRNVNLRLATFSGINRVHLGQGWREFTLENGCNEGDVLLFSLVKFSKFVVHMFAEAGK